MPLIAIFPLVYVICPNMLLSDKDVLCLKSKQQTSFLPVHVAKGHSGEFDVFHVLNHHCSCGWPAEVVDEATADLPNDDGKAACNYQQPQHPASLALRVDNGMHAMKRSG